MNYLISKIRDFGTRYRFIPKILFMIKPPEYKTSGRLITRYMMTQTAEKIVPACMPNRR